MFWKLTDDILDECFREVTRPLGIRTPSDRVSGKLSFVIHIPEINNQESGVCVYCMYLCICICLCMYK